MEGTVAIADAFHAAYRVPDGSGSNRSSRRNGNRVLTAKESTIVDVQVLLGDMGAGKSSLVRRFVKGQFFEYQESTIGAAFSTKTLTEHNVKFEIWDTAGQERYHSLAPMYYRGAAAAVIVYDISSSESFERAKSWVKELQRQGNPNMVMALAGNKADLAETGRKVSVEDAQQYAEENGLFFLETSAKNAQNVNELFEEVARKLPKTAPAPAPAGGITLTDRAPTKSTSNCC